ncbi:MAG: type 4a pilus biogenesis protein PilO [Smithella sp.]|jgi:type IV pilus assembly protein PilO
MAINLTLDDIKKMSPKAKLAVVVLIFLLVGYLYWFYFLSSAMEKKSSLSTKLTEMQEKINEKSKVAGQINKYMTDVAALQESYKLALQKLPDQREIPTLFHTVALAGKEAGVEFLLFEPKAAVPKMLEKQQDAKVSSLLKPSDQRDQKKAAAASGGKKSAEPPPEPFYEEIPVGVSVIGTYQNILYFFNKVAKLPRIVNVSDIYMGDRRDVKGRGQLITSKCTIKTYMFIDKKEKPSEKTK